MEFDLGFKICMQQDDTCFKKYAINWFDLHSQTMWIYVLVAWISAFLESFQEMCFETVPGMLWNFQNW